MSITVAEYSSPDTLDLPEFGPGGSPALGLVTCAITARTPLTVEELLSRGLAFPSADLVGAAASLFPVPDRGSAVTSRARVFRGADLSEWHSDREGPVSVLSIAPGMVKLSRFDPARRERALANNATGEMHATRGAVSNWSPKSRGRMMIAIRQLDLNSYVAGRIPVMVTLTLPGDWLAVAPDAAAATAAFRRFVSKYRRRWGSVVWLWKREFQRRGAPHWHLWLVPPVQDLDVFRKWLSLAWTESLAPARGDCDGLEACNCSEWCRSLAAGTGVDRAAGMNARDPQRLAVYFLKESSGGDDKSYQNSVPWAWCVGGLLKGEQGPFPAKKIPRSTVGRFWGTAGLDKAVVSVEMDENISVKVWRAMSAARATKLRINDKPMTRTVRSMPGVVVLAPVVEYERMRDDDGAPWLVSAGEHSAVETDWSKRRPVARVVKTTQTAGWVGVNDGPAYASQLARYVLQLSGDTSTTRDVLPPALAHLSAQPVNEKNAIRLRVLRSRNLRAPRSPSMLY